MAVGLRAAWDAAPPRLRQAAQDLVTLRERDGVHLFGVRHHSPACAVAVAALVEEVRPSVVLVEQRGQEPRVLLRALDEHDRGPDLLYQGGHGDRARRAVVPHAEQVHAVALA